MTERQAAQERIEFLAHHDPLTELPNRLLLRDRMQAMARATRMQNRGAMFLDLDRFKKINDLPATRSATPCSRPSSSA
jgi:GGDEF domain-containing protein